MKKNSTQSILTKLILLSVLIIISFFIVKAADDEDTSEVALEIYSFTEAPIIDGIIDEGWQNNEYIAIENIIEQYSIKTDFNADDYMPKFKISWFGNKLYFLMEINDDILFDENEDVWANDGFSINLDLGNEKLAAELDSNDHNLIFAWGNIENMAIYSGDPNIEWQGELREEIEYGETIDIENKKLIAEIAFDVKDLNMPRDLADDVMFGLDIEVYDYDGEGSFETGDRDITAYWYSTTGTGWFDRTVFGSVGLGGVKLKSADATTNINNSKELNKISIFPVPANNELNIKSENDLTMVEIYDIVGNRVKSSQISSNHFVIDVSQLSPGIYTIKSYNQTGLISTQKTMIYR